MRFPDDFSYHCPLKISCGRHALAGLPMALVGCGAMRPLILANHNQLGVKRFQKVVDAFRSSGLTVAMYDRIPDPLEPDLLALLLKLYQDGGCDSLIAVGCGAVVDAAKCLNVLVGGRGCGKKNGDGKNGTDSSRLRPLLLVATPGGNGNEATPYASDVNGLLCTPRLMPRAVFIDPLMMDGDEPSVLNGGLIGLVNAVEAFLDATAGPLVRAHAHTAISLMMHYLPMVIGRADYRESLSGVVCGQMIAGCAFSTSSPGVCHTLANHLTTSTDLPLGYLMAILLPYLLAEISREHPHRVGGLLYPMAGEEDFALTAKDLQAPRAISLLLEFYEALNRALIHKIPTALKHAGLADERIRQVQDSLRTEYDDQFLVNILTQAR